MPIADTNLRVDCTHLRPGMRVAVGVSGGADSVALLRALHARSRELGLALHVAHLHHGLRGDEADADLEFVRALAAELDLPFHLANVDTAAEAAARAGKAAETIEEAARRLRYAWFRELMGGRDSLSPVPSSEGPGAPKVHSRIADAVVTAHTLDDQAETVLGKFLRGAWTKGLSGIHPVVDFAEGRIVRPLLGTTRAEVEAFLGALGQGWREDSSNRHLTFTRNRIRHELLPLLEGWNPRLKEHLAQMAELARAEDAWWAAEVGRIAAVIVAGGKPVRGGGRAATEDVAVDLVKLRELGTAEQRRILRYAAGRLEISTDYQGTEAMRELALGGRAGQKCELAQGLRVERTHRELRLSLAPSREVASAEATAVPVPGEADAPEFGWRIRIESDGQAQGLATLRTWKPGDRVLLQHSSGPRKVKEVLERLKVSGAARSKWPVLELDGRILWMQGVAVEPLAGVRVLAIPLGAEATPSEPE